MSDLISKKPHCSEEQQGFFGSRAEDGTRTRDPNLGKVMLYQLSYFREQCVNFFLYSKRDLNPHSCNSQRILSPSCLPIPPFEHPLNNRAEDGTRTRDPNLGKVMLYQLSYFRMVCFSFAIAKVLQYSELPNIPPEIFPVFL